MKKRGKGYFPLPFLQYIYMRKSNLVCMCMSTSPPFKHATILNIQPIWLPWQPILLYWHCTASTYYINFYNVETTRKCI